MSTATAPDITTAVASGEYTVDALHSSASFEVEHAGVSIFRGAFKPIDATLVAADGRLELNGRVPVEGVSVDDENIRPHLLSPEFFDVERNPEIGFRSTEISGSADRLEIAGELSMAGASLPVTATGRLRGPIEGPGGTPKLALSLETVVDRTAFGMNWQMELPDGNQALANDVKLVVELELNGQ